jgi:ribosomal-protein-alanine N-acetyltransferase
MSAVVSPLHPAIRAMHEGDINNVVAVEYAAYEFPWTYGIFRDCLRAGYWCHVFESAQGLVGHGVMSLGAGECHLLNICVHPLWQRQGLGSEMVEFLLDLARRRNTRLALLEVRFSNRAAYSLYTRLGFDEVGVRKNYYPAAKGREDALILARDLTV